MLVSNRAAVKHRQKLLSNATRARTQTSGHYLDSTRNGREDRQLRSCFDYSQDVHVMHLNFKLDVFADSESTKGTTQRSITKELCSRGGFSTHNRSGILSWEVHVFVIVCALACAFRHGMK